MLLSNDFTYDPRVKKEAKTLSENSFDVSIIAWNRENEEIKVPDENYKVYFSKRKSGTAEGLKKIFKIIFFWYDCIEISNNLSFDFVHCHDLDTLPVGYIISRKRKVKLIYDSHESYPDLLEENLPHWFVFFIRKLEKFLIKRCDGVITVGERLANALKERGGRNIEIIGNWKDKNDFDFLEEEIKAFKKKYGVEDNKIVISYTGGLYKKRNIIPLIEAVKKRKEFYLILAGMGTEEDLIKKETSNCNNILFLGKVAEEDIPKIAVVSDIIYYCLSEENKNSFYSAPNKLFEALAGGKALIATKNIGEIGEIVEREKLGFLVEKPKEGEIEKALDFFLNGENLKKCQDNSKRLFEEKFNWERAEKKLIDFYNILC